jgi:hypothetical protein
MGRSSNNDVSGPVRATQDMMGGGYDQSSNYNKMKGSGPPSNNFGQ